MLIVLILLFLLALAALALFIAARLILNKIFGSRCEGNPNITYFQSSDFPGLRRCAVSFPSNRGQTLRGSIYSMDRPSYRGVIIFVHGMGGGHTAYMTEIHTLARAGYLVLGYDNTGTMLSDGAELGGFPQAFLDLQGAVSFIRNASQYRTFPLFLVGHSWGAYTVCNFPHLKEHVDGVVAMSPFDSIPNQLVYLLQSQTGKKLTFLKPFFSLCLLLDYKGAALYRPSYSLQKITCPVLLLHGDQDPMVPLSLSPIAFRSSFESDPRIQIQICPGRMHNVYACAEAEEYLNTVFSGYAALEKQYNGHVPEDLRQDYWNKVDFRRMTQEDPAVISLILDFLEQCLPLEK